MGSLTGLAPARRQYLMDAWRQRSGAPNAQQPIQSAATAKPSAQNPASYQDAGYFTDYARIAANFAAGQSQIKNAGAYDKDSLNRALTSGQSNLDAALKQLAFNQEDTNRNASFSLHKQGLLNSGEFERTMGRLQQQYDMSKEGMTSDWSNQKAGLQANYDYGNKQRNAELAQLISTSGTGGTDYQSANQEALSRALARDAAAPAPPVKATLAPKTGYTNINTSGARAGQSYNERRIGNIIYHVYANGTKVPIRVVK